MSDSGPQGPLVTNQSSEPSIDILVYSESLRGVVKYCHGFPGMFLGVNDAGSSIRENDKCILYIELIDMSVFLPF